MIRITIEGKEIPIAQIQLWEQERVNASKKFLESKLKMPVPVTNAEELAQFKADLTDEQMRACLRANPDHYLLKGVNATDQEVIEFTGGLLFSIQFTIRYGDFHGLVSVQEPEYSVQAAGASYLSNGFCIGAVRHQIRNAENGCKVKLSVEFPALLPKANIEAHQRHLAIEFYNWFSTFEARVAKG